MLYISMCLHLLFTLVDPLPDDPEGGQSQSATYGTIPSDLVHRVQTHGNGRC
jgi:hypothetical protein